MVIADGHLLCVIMVQVLGSGRLEHEFLIHKCFHGAITPFSLNLLTKIAVQIMSALRADLALISIPKNVHVYN